jgi:predicted pyridoxine 5'-phosphate oxidase superfamily flavin-nucleotide-binding protein
MKLSDIAVCFEGWIPATLVSCSKSGVPNVIHLSQVHLVGEDHLALSRQFFNKTVRNIAENPQVALLLTDPSDWTNYRLSARFERAETQGPTFERLRSGVEAVAEATGASDIFRLKSADIYRVLHIERVPDCVVDEDFRAEAS